MTPAAAQRACLRALERFRKLFALASGKSADEGGS